MKIKKIKLAKSLKMALLLVSSLLIASVSAAVYNSLTLKSQISIQTQPVQFTNGADTPSGSTVNPTYCVLSLSCYPNSTTTYEKAVNITNTDTSPHDIRLRHVSISPNGTSDVGNFTSITFYLLDASGNQQASMTYTTSNNTWSVSPSETSYVSIPGGNTNWTIKVVIVTSENAQANISCNVEMALDVK